MMPVQWFNTYGQLLGGYMRRDTGVGMDLTLVRHSPVRWHVIAAHAYHAAQLITLLTSATFLEVCLIVAQADIRQTSRRMRLPVHKALSVSVLPVSLVL